MLTEQTVHQVNGIRFFLHHHVCVYFRGVDVGVSKKFARRVQVAASSECHRGESMTARMERDRLSDSCFLGKALQSPVGTTERGHICKNPIFWRSFISFRQPGPRLNAKWNDNWFTRLLH